MAAIKELDLLLQGLDPHLNPGIYVFVNAPFSTSLIANAVGFFKEEEGITYILKESYAQEQNLSFDYQAAWISLHVHSALDAVGLTAVVANTLAENNISCNVVAAYYHDHIFVDYGKREKAVSLLKMLSESAKNNSEKPST